HSLRVSHGNTMSTYKHDRPTIGVVTGWQMYWGSLASFFAPMLQGIHAAAQRQGCNVLAACGVSHATLTTEVRPAWPVLAPDTDFVPVGPWNTEALIVFTPL